MQLSGVTAQETRDQFLHLLVTQLQHQDPLEPMKQEEFLSQLAQFSTLEGIENLQSVIESQTEVQQESLRFQQLGQAADLVGKKVEYVKLDGEGTPRLHSGVVDLVAVDENGLSFRVHGDTIGWSDIQSISGHVTGATEAPLSDDGGQTDQPLQDASESSEQGTVDQENPNSTADGEAATQLSRDDAPFRRTRDALAEELPEVEPLFRRGRDAFLDNLGRE